MYNLQYVHTYAGIYYLRSCWTGDILIASAFVLTIFPTRWEIINCFAFIHALVEFVCTVIPFRYAYAHIADSSLKSLHGSNL